MNVRTLFAAGVVAASLVACAAPDAQSNISVKDAWARPTIGLDAQGENTAASAGNEDHSHGGMAMDGVNGAAYMVIENKGHAADKLLSVNGDVAEVIQVHQTKDNNGLMTMEQMKDGVEIPANGSLALKPASYHIMLMQMKRALKPGDTFKLTLKFQSGKEIPVDVAVRES